MPHTKHLQLQIWLFLDSLNFYMRECFSGRVDDSTPVEKSFRRCLAPSAYYDMDGFGNEWYGERYRFLPLYAGQTDQILEK